VTVTPAPRTFLPLRSLRLGVMIFSKVCALWVLLDVAGSHKKTNTYYYQGNTNNKF